MRYRDDFIEPGQFPQSKPEKEAMNGGKSPKRTAPGGVDTRIAWILAGVLGTAAVLSGLAGNSQEPHQKKGPDVREEKKNGR